MGGSDGGGGHSDELRDPFYERALNSSLRGSSLTFVAIGQHFGAQFSTLPCMFPAFFL